MKSIVALVAYTEQWNTDINYRLIHTRRDTSTSLGYAKGVGGGNDGSSLYSTYEHSASAVHPQTAVI